MISRAWLWLRSILFRARHERDMQEEILAHLGRAADRFEATGMCVFRCARKRITFLFSCSPVVRCVGGA